jgi:hypothetical protein
MKNHVVIDWIRGWARGSGHRLNKVGVCTRCGWDGVYRLRSRMEEKWSYDRRYLNYGHSPHVYKYFFLSSMTIDHATNCNMYAVADVMGL